MLTSETTANDRYGAEPTALATEPIELPGGWSGKVLTGGPLSNISVGTWREALSHLISGANTDGRTTLKRSKTTDLFRVRMELGSTSIEVVCKHVLARGRSRTTRQWDCATHLARLKINTALPLACIERTTPTREAWMITQAIPDVVDLERIAAGLLNELEPAHARKVKRTLTERVASLCRAIEAAGLYHRDFKASNILVSDWDAAAQLWLVDLDGIHRRRFYHRDAPWRAIMRLAASVAGCHALTRTDSLRFLRTYLETTDSHADQWKHHWRRLQRAVADYNRRSQARKRGKIDGFNGS